MLVEPEQMTGDHSKVAPIDGPVKGFSAAKIGILVRNKHCVCPNCLCEVVTGNIPGARAPNDRDLE